jgi:hypothetical protein
MESVPSNKTIHSIKQYIQDHPDMKLLGENSGGFEIRYSAEAKDWLLKLVEENQIRFDNPGRIQNNHPYILLLPEK